MNGQYKVLMDATAGTPAVLRAGMGETEEVILLLDVLRENQVVAVTHSEFDKLNQAGKIS